MKALLLIAGIITSGIMIFTVESGMKNTEPYRWQRVANPGSGRWPEQWEEGKWPMGITPVEAFGKLWMIGARNSWSSDDGLNWIAFSKADWGIRHSMSTVYFKNKLWMAGGMTDWHDFRNDIWSSTDGKKWIKEIGQASWEKRIGHEMVVFNNKLWLIGGTLTSGDRKKIPTHFLNDIWSSDDGINWKREVEKAPWTARHGARVLVFKNRIWLLGGGGEVGRKPKGDVWNSNDGINWTKVTDTALWKARTSNGVLVFDNSIWIYGGIDNESVWLNDVWRSEDGIQWEQVNDHAPWTPRSTDTSAAFRDQLWIYSGKTSREEDTWSGDIWALSKE
jgi:hypothetical protein